MTTPIPEGLEGMFPEPEPIDLESPPVTTVSAYRVTSDKTGFPVADYFELITPPSGDEPQPVTFTFISVRSKQEIGIQLNPDGSIKVGGWDTDGEWVELAVTTSPEDEFDLAAYGNALEGNITPI